MTIQETYDFKAVEGLHFGMSDEDYFSIPCLSASGLKVLKSNPSKFWWQSWMNPDKEDNETEAKILGRAFHKRILEGKAAFDEVYAPEFSPDGICDPDDLIKSSDDIKAALRKEKESNPDVKLTFKSKREGFDRLYDLDVRYHDVSYESLLSNHLAKYEGKIFLNDWVMNRIELCANVIEMHPSLKASFVGGYSEVSCVWFDKELGVWFKCRYDYLKVQAINDLKTFTRMSNKEIERYLPDTITKYLYHIQATHYLDSMVYAKQFAKEGKVYGFKDDEAWLKAFAERPCEQFHFIFQQKEEVPNAYEVIYSVHHGMHESARLMIKHAVDEFKIYSERYGDEMWVELKPAQVLTDDDYPIYAW